MPDGKDGTTNPLAYRKIHSDSDGQRYKAREMVYLKRRWTIPMAENRLLYSSYNALFWVNDGGADDGMITIGPYSDTNYCGWTDNGTTMTAVQNGLQTWDAISMTMRTITATDCSSATTVVFSLEFCPHQDREETTYSVTIGDCDSSGVTKHSVSTWSLVGGNRIWAKITTADMADSANAYFYFEVTPDVATSKWAFTNAQVEFDKTEPGQFVETAGSAIVETSTERRGVGKLHRSEWELVQENWEGVVTPREGQDQASYTIPTEDV